MIITCLFLLLLILLAIGAPVAVALGLASMITIFVFGDESLQSVAIKLYATADHYTLLAIPFFLLAGAFMTTGGMARRLIDFANATLGHVKGGLPISAIFACVMFAALSGSSPATVAAVGSIVIAGMVRSGYSEQFATGVVCNAGTLGILIPPSIVLVVYGSATSTSVGNLFMAGVVPGVMLGLLLMVATYVIARIKDMPAMPRASVAEWWVAARRAAWGLLLGVIILGGIYLGFFTATEAAAVAAVYSVFVSLVVYRDINLFRAPKVILDAARLSVALMFIIANAMLFAHVLTSEQIPQAITQWAISLGLSPVGFLLIVNLLLLAAGSLMEPSAIILILAPILFPMAKQMGIDPVHLGIIMVVNMEIGMLTPPTGLNLFVASTVTGQSLTQVIRACAPWLLLLLGFLAVITYVPGISLALPRALGMM